MRRSHRPLHPRRAWPYLALAAALVVVACQQVAPQPPIDVLGEGDTLEYAPGRTGEVRVATLPGPGGTPITFHYEVIDGLVLVQGDMILGDAAEFEAWFDEADAIDVGTEASALSSWVCWTFLGIPVHCEYYRWPNAVVPYVYVDDWDDPAVAGDENSAMRTTIRAAMDAIEDVSAVRFVPRAGQDDYVQFRDGDGCSATVGHQGEAQNVNLNVACNQRWIVAHEILHALGFNHEQAREDRDASVQVHMANVQDGKGHNFEIADHAFDLGAYDYDSLMHYGTHDFCKRDAAGACIGPTITTVPAGTAIGQRSHLSATDVAALNAIYPGVPPVVAIVSPAPGTSFSRRSTNVYFDADVVDPEGADVTVTWRSDVNGLLATGNPVSVNTGALDYGAHVITARATDPQGNVDTDTVALQVVNDAPTVDLYTPLAGDFCVAEPITFRATVIDLNELGATLPNASVAWRVGTASPFATGKTVVRTFGTAGDVQVIVRATDELGLFAEDWVSLGIDVCADAAPVVVITVPASDVDVVYDGFDSGRDQWYADVSFAGSASDLEDGALTGGSLVWTTNRSDLQGAVLGTGTNLTARLYSNVCEGAQHTITLTATDSSGHVRTAVVRVFIWTLC
jgi:hypothetical protein